MTTSVAPQLQRLVTQLSVADQRTLLAFAEFLHSRSPPLLPAIPQIVPRPPTESVVAALKRLSKSYPMLDKAKLLDQTSSLVTEHLLQGRDQSEVIDQLEAIFARHYEQFLRDSMIPDE